MSEDRGFSKEKTKIEKSNLLVVEGRDEELFFGALLKHLGINNIQVVEVGGKTKFRDRLNALILTPNFREKVTSLGIVRDANKDPKGTFQSICDSLKVLGLPVPEHPLISEGVHPKVTIMILPEENTPGMLEDICLKSIQNDPTMFCIEQFFKCLREKEIQMPQNESKAKVQIFLASRKEAGKRLGEAAQAGYWPWDDVAFKEIKNFLNKISI